MLKEAETEKVQRKKRKGKDKSTYEVSRTVDCAQKAHESAKEAESVITNTASSNVYLRQAKCPECHKLEGMHNISVKDVRTR